MESSNYSYDLTTPAVYFLDQHFPTLHFDFKDSDFEYSDFVCSDCEDLIREGSITQHKFHIYRYF
jgi:hypothetical protein